ncbi:protein translocase subunit SecF [Ostreibacterium oceani]|uniref:Protein-export membrane protein SecF n=1 Tax=Ostreibacterium oceani TaxID=2654998 RepID=A0A6N7EW78_9GAMM|nr:protein translocase subunit SecF [Ostreibacterium oceani]MPV85679.1 protein translocase subunit SecF [Ostreibacterium oceani]
MQFVSKKLANLDFNYLSKVKTTFFISLILIVISIYSLSTQWLNLGLDFTGGITVELQATQNVDTETIRNTLAEKGFPDNQVVHYGTESTIQIKIPPTLNQESDVSTELQHALADSGYQFTFLGQSLVGAQFGQELVDKGLYALIIALAGIMLYVSIRFQWKLALGAVAALAHDLLITLGFFSLTQIEFNLTVLAALLAVLGYSVNDTVVVFDRIRENFRLMHQENEFNITNQSINQTMPRTLITSTTTLLSVAALAIFGGPILFGFSLALIVGILIGTYSSIFVASALAMQLKLSKDDLTPKAPEDIDDLP